MKKLTASILAVSMLLPAAAANAATVISGVSEEGQVSDSVPISLDTGVYSVVLSSSSTLFDVVLGFGIEEDYGIFSVETGERIAAQRVGRFTVFSADNTVDGMLSFIFKVPRPYEECSQIECQRGSYVADEFFITALNNAPTNYSVTISRVGAVPEPATWALLILGFGIVGASMRYRRRTNANVRFSFARESNFHCTSA